MTGKSGRVDDHLADVSTLAYIDEIGPGSPADRTFPSKGRMTDERSDKVGRPSGHELEWERSERRSYRIALAIALLPIPISLLISWALGSPPWRPRPRPDDGATRGALAAPERAGPRSDRGHR